MNLQENHCPRILVPTWGAEKAARITILHLPPRRWRSFFPPLPLDWLAVRKRFIVLSHPPPAGGARLLRTSYVEYRTPEL